MSSASCPHGLDTGAYVLGALHDDEQRAFEQHLAGCEACRREVGELRMAAAMLPLAADQVAPPDALRERIMRTVREEATPQAASAAGSGAIAGMRRRLHQLPRARPRPAVVAWAAAEGCCGAAS